MQQNTPMAYAMPDSEHEVGGSRRPAMKNQPQFKKITIYIDRWLDVKLENICQNRMLQTGQGAHVHTKSGLINEILTEEMLPSFSEYSDYVPTEERLLRQGWQPAEQLNPTRRAPRRSEAIQAVAVDTASRPGARRRSS